MPHLLEILSPAAHPGCFPHSSLAASRLRLRAAAESLVFKLTDKFQYVWLPWGLSCLAT